MVLGRFGWFWVVPCFSNYALLSLKKCYCLGATKFVQSDIKNN